MEARAAYIYLKKSDEILIGVVSDTHNNQNNIKKIISLFNKEQVSHVIHTGDITNSASLSLFSKLNCPLSGVYGNNDRVELGLEKVANDLNFKFQNPPLLFSLNDKKLAIFHEPDNISKFQEDNQVDIILHGHTHRHREEVIKNTLIFNPGESAGIMKGKNALGLIYLGEAIRIKRVFF